MTDSKGTLKGTSIFQPPCPLMYKYIQREGVWMQVQNFFAMFFIVAYVDCFLWNNNICPKVSGADVKFQILLKTFKRGGSNGSNLSNWFTDGEVKSIISLYVVCLLIKKKENK